MNLPCICSKLWIRPQQANKNVQLNMLQQVHWHVLICRRAGLSVLLKTRKILTKETAASCLVLSGVHQCCLNRETEPQL